MLQIFGTVLQLMGSVVAFYGLASAWQKTTGQLTRWVDDFRDRWVEFIDAVIARFTPPPSEGSVIAATLPMMTAHMEVYVDNGTDQERLTRLETENARRADEIRETRGEIDKAKAEVLEEFQAFSDAIRLDDLKYAALGLFVNIVGIGLQLAGQWTA
ncbi:hypothetical protein A5647_24210 [Mycobacterium sp. 1100029.7]|nr:hypothetical protein A5647_24210 [Mycobacterium sp. 1100029.7]